MRALSDFELAFCELMSVADFKAAVAAGAYTDYDGYGYPAHYDTVDPENPIVPSELQEIPKWATKIVWFNK